MQAITTVARDHRPRITVRISSFPTADRVGSDFLSSLMPGGVDARGIGSLGGGFRVELAQTSNPSNTYVPFLTEKRCPLAKLAQSNYNSTNQCMYLISPRLTNRNRSVLGLPAGEQGLSFNLRLIQECRNDTQLVVPKSIGRAGRSWLLQKRSQLPRGMDLEHLEPKMMLTGPQIVGITPNAGELLQDGDTRNTAPQELTFRFDENQVIDEATLGGISIFSFNDGRTIEPGFIGVGERSNEVVLRFAEALENGSYRIDIRGAGPDALRNVEGEAFNDGVIRSVSFNLDLAPLVTAVVPQPISRDAAGGLSQARNRIDVYFNDDDLLASSAQQPRFYQLIYTADTVTNADDVVHLPTAVSYDAVTDTAALTFDSDLVDLSGEGTYRLRVGTDESLPAVPVVTDITEDVGDTFGSAFDLGTLTRTDQVVTSAIDTATYPLTFPGGFGEPGRPSFPDIPEDEQDGITIVEYNFQSLIVLEDGSTFFNLITEEQKERAREMVDILSANAGVQFVETLNSGITVGTATLPGLFPDVVAVPFTFDNDEFGGSWFNEAMRQMIAQLDSEFFAVPDPTFAIEDPTRDFAFIRPVFIDPKLA